MRMPSEVTINLRNIVWRMGEELNEARQEVSLGEVEQSVQDVDTRVVQLDEFVRIFFLHLLTAKKAVILVTSHTKNHCDKELTF